MWKYIFSAWAMMLATCWLDVQAQSDTVSVKIEKDWAPSAIRVGTEVTGPLFGLFNDSRSQYEITADIDFHRYFLVADYGYEQRTREGQSFLFETKGNYWRVGADINFLQSDPSRSVLYFGLRYARATFSGNLNFSDVDTTLYGTTDLQYEFDDYTAQWGEAVVGLKVQVVDNFYLGLAGRFKFALDVGGELAVSAYEVPGFGVADDNSSFGLDYYVYYRIGWRNKPIPPKRK